MHQPRRVRAALAPVVALLAGTLVAVLARVAPAAAATPVLTRSVIGYSVQHRPIVAYHLGDPRISRVSVILGQMHGDEHAGVVLANSIVRGTSSVEGLNLWVIPTMNPDGDAVHTRQNAHHVDLNRNWPDYWTHLTGEYYSGPRALSEPETRAMYTFLNRLRPHYLISIHQPLDGVDSTDGGRLDPGLRTRLARNLGLPVKAFRCWSFCHGSMTGWYTTHRYGIGETIEFGSRPSTSYLTGQARRGIVAAIGGHFGSLAAHNPKTSMRVGVRPGAAHVYGWAFDPDARSAHLRIALYRDGRLQRTAYAAAASPDADAHYDLTGGHGYSWSVTAPAGPHRYCVTFRNLYSGTANVLRCASVTVPATA